MAMRRTRSNGNKRNTRRDLRGNRALRFSESVEPGTIIELALDDGSTLEGMVSEVRRRDGETYVRLYSHAWRDATEFRIDGRGHAHAVRSVGIDRASGTGRGRRKHAHAVQNADRDPDTAGTGSPPDHHYRSVRRSSFLIAMFAVVISLVVVLPVVQGAFIGIETRFLSFDHFVARDLSLPRVVSFASARLQYRPDVEEYWSAPRAAWNSRSGDCEDYASIISAYLRVHEIDHVVVSMSLKGELQGHAAVVAFTETGTHLMDPTRATTPLGYQRFPPETPLTEVLRPYAVFPVQIHEPPISPGRPVPDRSVP